MSKHWDEIWCAIWKWTNTPLGSCVLMLYKNAYIHNIIFHTGTSNIWTPWKNGIWQGSTIFQQIKWSNKYWKLQYFWNFDWVYTFTSTWCLLHENCPTAMCKQQMPRSGCSSAELSVLVYHYSSHWSLYFSVAQILERAKPLIRLCGVPGHYNL